MARRITVLMQFGDGSSKEIEMELEDDQEDEAACEMAKEWVNDNAWFELADDQTENRERND